MTPKAFFSPKVLATAFNAQIIIGLEILPLESSNANIQKAMEILELGTILSLPFSYFTMADFILFSI